MGGASLWAAENVINVAATGGAALLCWWRWRAAEAAARLPHRRASVSAIRRRNAALLRAYTVVNAALATLGAYLIGVALGWRGAVPSFVTIGTGAFALIWVGWAGVAVWDWRAMARIAELAAAERRGID